MITVFLYLVLFVIFGFLGWFIDTFFNSFLDKKYSPHTFISFFSVIYGIGGVILFFIYSSFNPGFLTFISGLISIILLELIGGLFCVYVLKRRLWDYRKNQLNFLGHVDAEHSCYWFVLCIIFYEIYWVMIV
ncbi:MAG: hypothetical protein Q7R52_02935 [archaeon]|nr:hypothetical protein [archaeon]